MKLPKNINQQLSGSVFASLGGKSVCAWSGSALTEGPRDGTVLQMWGERAPSLTGAPVFGFTAIPTLVNYSLTLQ